MRGGDLPLDADARMVGQAAPDRKVGDDIDPELLELLVWPDPAAQEHGGRAVRAGREDHDVRREAPAVGRHAVRTPAVERHAVDQCLGRER